MLITLIILVVLLIVLVVLLLVKISRKETADRLAAVREEEFRQATLREEVRRREEDNRRREEDIRRREEDEKRREAEERRQAELRQAQRLSEEEARKAETERFRNIANELLSKHAESLRAENTRQIDALLSPLAQNLTDFRKMVNDCYVQENASRRSLSDQVDRLMHLNESIGTEARNLTSALKGNSKVQGDWGEMILSTMLEQAGLKEGVHFRTQVTRDSLGNPLRDEAGHLQRPDMVVYLPEGRNLVIDSKVSLTAYADACASDDEQQRATRLRSHVLSVRKHIDELAAKRYDRIVEGSASYVMMFIPNEGAYITALQADDTLWQYAFDKGIALVSPTHLFSVMHLISQLWVQDKQTRHTLLIAEKGASLYTKIMGFMEAMESVGTALGKAQENFDAAMARLATGRGNMAKLSCDLRDLGIKAKKQMPPLTRRLMENDPEAEEESEQEPDKLIE
ncbi:MAG: DNA recombination protein RmuC [Bacteroidales bacterium]|nr:DNA recombination protein RmuC [Bacteroidales bacterium]